MAGAAEPLSAYVVGVEPFDFVRAPRNIREGDLLVAFVSANDVGVVNEIDISGGNPWVPQDQSTDSFDTRVFTQVAGSNNPRNYLVEVPGGGVVGLLHLRNATPAGMRLETLAGGFREDGRVPTPALTPGAAGGVEVRYAVVWNPIFDLFWDWGGFDEEDQGGGFGSYAFLGANTRYTGAGLPSRWLEHDSVFVSAWQSWTLVFEAGDYVPPPPPAPKFTQGMGRALYRYTAHDLMTGGYLDDLYPQDVSYDKRIGEPGAFSCRLPIPNRTVAEAVRRIIPRVREDLTTGPGRFEVRIWREGELWGRYWITGARLSRGRDGKIAVELRGSTLDAYFHSLRIRQDIFYEGNPVANVRTLLQHAMSKPGAWSGLEFMPGSAGDTKTLLINADDGQTYGQAAEEESSGEGAFEWTLHEEVGPSGVVSRWVWGYPKLTSDRVHVFTESPHGGEIAEWSLEIDALQGGTHWQTRGGTPESEDASEDTFPVWSGVRTSPHAAAGWPRIDHQMDHPTQSTSVFQLNAYTKYWADAAGGAMWVRQVTVILGANPSLNMNCLGDYARFIMSNVWYERTEEGGAGLDIRERIIGIQIKPTSRGVGKEEAVLTLETLEVPSS